jgi:hypothetical protein
MIRAAVFGLRKAIYAVEHAKNNSHENNTTISKAIPETGCGNEMVSFISPRSG